MMAGKKIQKYRKELKMSQEELGQKLLVSRQTISLWEKDQTLPTIDNLIRLSEVFGVSIDEILNTDTKPQEKHTEPSESYQFNFTKFDLKKIYGLQRNAFCKKLVIFILVSVFLIAFFIGTSAPDLIIGLVFGIFFTGIVSYIKGIYAVKKSWEQSIDQVCKSDYYFKIFEDYITINIYRENEKIRESKCCFKDIERIQLLDKWLVLQFEGQAFILRKEELKENSEIYSIMDKNLSKSSKGVLYGKLKIISNLLFTTSLLSLFLALYWVMALSNANNLFIENMWIFFLMIPIPLASAIFGFIMKFKGYKYKKNVIIGIIMTIIMLIYGSFTFIF